MIRFALIVASTLGFVLTAALGNFMAPLLQELERFRPQEQQEPQTPVQSRVPALGGLCLMVSTLVAVGVGWTAACIAQPTLLGSESQLMTRLLIRAQLGLRRLPRLALEAAAAAAVLVLLAVNGCLPTGLQLPGAGYVELGGAAPVLWGLVLVALAECARTADGADGTVCGTAFAAMLGLMMLETRLGWFPLAVLPAALAGALLAFLLWNFPPAKLRPGSCGCLYLAGVLGCVPLCIGYAELSIPLALPFWAEGGMVLLQILYHRITGRRARSRYFTGCVRSAYAAWRLPWPLCAEGTGPDIGQKGEKTS